ncbi:MAG TPA: hypothetical protein VGM23_14670 [Armatimonadota bacterium]
MDEFFPRQDYEDMLRRRRQAQETLPPDGVYRSLLALGPETLRALSAGELPEEATTLPWTPQPASSLPPDVLSDLVDRGPVPGEPGLHYLPYDGTPGTLYYLVDQAPEPSPPLAVSVPEPTAPLVLEHTEPLLPSMGPSLPRPDFSGGGPESAIDLPLPPEPEPAARSPLAPPTGQGISLDLSALPTLQQAWEAAKQRLIATYLALQAHVDRGEPIDTAEYERVKEQLRTEYQVPVTLLQPSKEPAGAEPASKTTSLTTRKKATMQPSLRASRLDSKNTAVPAKATLPQQPHQSTKSTPDTTTPWDLGREWLTGTGPRLRFFKDGDSFTELLKKHRHVAETRRLIAQRIAKGELNAAADHNTGSNPYSLAGIQGVPKFIADYATIGIAQSGNLAASYLGSYNLNYRVLNIDKEKGTAQVRFYVQNYSTLASGTRPPVIGYTKWYRKYIGDKINTSRAHGGPMSQTEQRIRWTETIPLHP